MNIKERDYTKVTSEYAPQEPINSNDVVAKMEAEWPLMTEEFKKLQREQYYGFV